MKGKEKVFSPELKEPAEEKLGVISFKGEKAGPSQGLFLCAPPGGAAGKAKPVCSARCGPARRRLDVLRSSPLQSRPLLLHFQAFPGVVP